MADYFHFALKQKTISRMPVGVGLVAAWNIFAGAIFIGAASEKLRVPAFEGAALFFGLYSTLRLVSIFLIVAAVVCLLCRRILLAAFLERAVFWALLTRSLTLFAYSLTDVDRMWELDLLLVSLLLLPVIVLFRWCSVYLEQVGNSD